MAEVMAASLSHARATLMLEQILSTTLPQPDRRATSALRVWGGAIGSYVNFPTNQETMFLSIKILSSLSRSPSFQNTAALIERSSESTIILDGFVRLLASDSADNVGAAEEWTDL
ncbi:hypothetical protein DFH11DRAFT_1732747 [Phellopilus nigrolimitatus]|nr:hypothetical protein DFH11DRAFT_1732747 [Phellopilus nigrolimitatus]